MTKVAIFAYDRLATFEFGCALEIFGMERPEFKDWYKAQVVSLEKNQVSGTCNILISTTIVENFDDFDLLIIPGWRIDNGDSFHTQQKLIEAVQSFYKKGGRILSFCTGAFVLAQAGLLNGRKATTHWRYASQFKELYPDITFVENVLYIYDGQIGCSAGSAAALDLGLEVVRRDYGHDKANQVARRLVIPPHRSGGQAQYVETPIMTRPNHFASTLDWAVNQLNTRLDIDALARKSNMSRRNFDRHFRASLGMSPKEWIDRQRLHLAQSLLQNKEFSMEGIAQQAGFSTAMNMRHHFRKTFGISPSEYQSQFVD